MLQGGRSSREGQLSNFTQSSRATAAAGPHSIMAMQGSDVSHERRADWPPAARPTPSVGCDSATGGRWWCCRGPSERTSL